ncbi:MAG: factor-independent urate hydroxylase, partial [Terracidiphilus sp.]
MARLGDNRYGKSRVRLSRITRLKDRHLFDEWTVHVMLEGDFDASYTEADNSKVLPTDTMKNTVYSVARRSKAATIEAFSMELGDYFLTNNAQVSGVLVEVKSRAWERLTIGGAPEATTFKLGGPELQTVHAVRDQGRGWSIRSGVDGLTILKTTQSAFTGYVVDKLTTLKPATDRILGTRATITWDYSAAAPDYAQPRERIVAALLTTFAAHNSRSVQHTLFDMGKAA